MEPGEQRKSKFIHGENVIKGLFTSLLGCVIMSAASYGWWIDHLTDLQGAIFGTIGFALLFMRDQIPAFISRFLNKKIDDNKE